MPNINDVFPSKYIDKEVVKTKGRIRAVIDFVAVEEVGVNREKKPVMHFKKTEKCLIMNKSNSLAVAEVLGQDYSKWDGHTVELTFDPRVEFQGKRVGGIRLDVPDDELAKLNSSQPGKSADTGSTGKGTDATLEEDLNDSIPF